MESIKELLEDLQRNLEAIDSCIGDLEVIEKVDTAGMTYNDLYYHNQNAQEIFQELKKLLSKEAIAIAVASSD